LHASYLLYLTSVWLHILAAAAWVGGMVFLVVVVVPVLRRPEYRPAAARMVWLTGVRFRALGWVCLAVLVATGVFNAAWRGVGLEQLRDPAFWGSSFGRALGWKLAVVLAILLVGAVHDFGVGARATRRWEAEAAAASTGRLRRAATWLARLTLLLSLAAVALGVILVRGWP